MNDDIMVPPIAQTVSNVAEAVRLALLERDVQSHGKRIEKLEAFRWWLLAGVAIAGCSSTGTLVLFILANLAKLKGQ